jgi:endonuclease/exonuclease/phosphatase family metal-dependent hydrolase
VKIATWNILGDQFDSNDRLQLVAREIREVDIVALQEVTIPEMSNLNTAKQLANMSNMKIASLVPGGVRNKVSGYPQATAILTNLDIVQSQIAISVSPHQSDLIEDECSSYAGAIVRTSSHRQILLISCHLPWGALREHRRLEHLHQINNQVIQIMNHLPSDSLAVIAGDFNTIPSGESLRYLRGEFGDFQNSTYWVDVWDEERDGPGFTFDPRIQNKNLIRTAKYSEVLRPELMPPRRLDYIFVRGWIYGKPGSPLRAKTIGNSVDSRGLHASDHFGVEAEIWDPPLEYRNTKSLEILIQDTKEK